MDIAQVFRDGFPAAVLRRFGWVFPAMVIAVFLGTAVLVTLPLWLLNCFLGVMVLIFVTSNWLHFDFTIPPQLEKLLALPVGFQRFSQRHDQCRRPRVGDLSVQFET